MALLTRYYDERDNLLFEDNPGLCNLYKIDNYEKDSPCQIVHNYMHYRVVKVEIVKDVQFVTIRDFEQRCNPGEPENKREAK